MIEHHVLDDFHATLVSLINEAYVCLVATESRVNLVVVGDGIAVIRRGRHVVHLQRRGPNGRHAKVVQIVQRLCHAGEVSAVSCVGFL